MDPWSILAAARVSIILLQLDLVVRVRVSTTNDLSRFLGLSMQCNVIDSEYVEI